MFRRSMLVRAFSALGAILILAAGCNDQGPTESSLAPQAAVLSKAHTPGTTSKIIGPSGGKLEFEIGSLTIPAGALKENTRISAEVDGTNLAVKFEPHGLVFPVDAKPTLTFDVSGVALPSSPLVYYLSDADLILEVLKAELSGLTLNAKLRHFSRYAIAAE